MTDATLFSGIPHTSDAWRSLAEAAADDPEALLSRLLADGAGAAEEDGGGCGGAEAGGEEPVVPEPDPALVAALAERFRGRADVFARQAVDARGTAAWYPVRGALSPAHFAAHLRGEVTLGLYPHLPDDTVRLAAIDLDVKAEYRDSFRKDAEVRARLSVALDRSLREARERLAAAGFPALSEDSGGRGRHLWIFFSAPASARAVRAALSAALSGFALPREFSFEIFPKSDRLDQGKIGNLIKLPLGVHRGSGRRSALLAPDGAPGEPLALLAATPAVDPERFMPPSGGGKIVSLDAWRRMTGSGAEGEAGSGDPARALLAGCPVVRSIAERAASGGEIAAVEAHVLIYALGVLGESGRAVCRRLLEGRPGYEPEVLEQTLGAVPPTAIGCLKIRKRLRGLIAEGECACRFDVLDGVYASPVIHAGFLPRASGGMMRPQDPPRPAYPAADPAAAQAVG